MEHQKLTHHIIGCAYDVFNGLGFGFLESVYRNALAVELRQTDLNVEVEKPLTVYYKGHVVGDFYTDLLVDESIIVELKSVERLASAHEVQVVNYLNASNIDIGLLINFGSQGVEVKRKYRRNAGEETK